MLPNYVELVTWKKANIEGVERYWSNSFQFQSDEPLTDGTAWTLCHNVATAENFMYPGDTHQFGFMVWTWSFTDKIAAKTGVYIWPDSRMGTRPNPDGRAVIPWEYALFYEKSVLNGRSGRMAFRHTLLDTEVVPYKENGLAVANHVPYGLHHTALIAYWLNNTPLRYGIWNRESELSYPTGFREVQYVGLGQLVKLGSVEDAQARKTPRAAPYKAYWEQSLVNLFQSVGHVYQLCAQYPDGMSKDDLPELETMVGVLKGNIEYVLTYWTEGVKPVLMLNWRPTSGLDPFSLPAQNLAGSAYSGIDEMAEVLSNLQAYPDPFIPLDAVMPFIQLFSYYVLLYERIGVMRWTGTPIRGLPKEY